MAPAMVARTKSSAPVVANAPTDAFEAPPPFDAADAGYHPARVTRKGGGWSVTGSEPAGPRSFSRQNHEEMPSEALFDNPGPGYQPSSRNGGRSLVGAGPTDAGSPAGVNEEMVPTPEPMDYGDEYSSSVATSGMGEAIFNGDGGFAPYTLPGRKWAMIAGGEGLMLRSHFSQATGMTETITTQSGNGTTRTANLIDFNPGYQGAFRAYLGFRNCACGDEIRFTYFNYNGTDSLAGTATSNTQFCDFLVQHDAQIRATRWPRISTWG